MLRTLTPSIPEHLNSLAYSRCDKTTSPSSFSSLSQLQLQAVMDPVTIFGTASAVADIVGVICTTVSTLRDIHDRWKEADMAIFNLITQLTALKAALKKITEWISSDLDNIPQHHQLVMDLKDSIHCCKRMIMTMDNQISKINWEDGTIVDIRSRIRVVFETKTSQDFQKYIKRQTNALTLLLVACNCRTLSEQKVVLEKPKNRQVFDQIKEDASSSLFVLYDSASFTSGWTASTENSSKLSRVFGFDRELMSTRVYQGSFRSLYKRTVRQKKEIDSDSVKSQSTTKSMISEKEEQKKRSKNIDKMLTEDSKKMRTECKVLVIGSPASGKDSIMKQMKIESGFTAEEYQAYRDQLRTKVIKDMRICISELMDLESENPQDLEVNKHAHTVLDYSSSMQEIPKELADAIESLWSAKRDGFCEQQFEIAVKLVPFFYDEIQRIAKPNYKPTVSDIFLLIEGAAGVQKIKFNLGNISLHAFDVGDLRGERKKWIHQFEGVTSIIFVVDLASYDLALILDESQNELQESLILFDSVVNSRWFLTSSIILLFTNGPLFMAKLAESPLQNIFSDYSGGDDFSKAKEYILWHFRRVHPSHKDLYPHFVRSNNFDPLQFIRSAINDTIVVNGLRRVKPDYLADSMDN